MNISVIIPCHDHAREVVEAVESALSQSLPPREIIVVDDGSGDGSADAVKSFGDKVRLISQEQKGPSSARNRAAREASGEWLALLDADDLWLPDKLKTQARFIEKIPEAALVHSDGWVIDGHETPPDKERGKSYFSTRTPPTGVEAYKAFMASPLLTSSVMIRREVFEQEGGFDEEFWVNEDADLFLRIMARGQEVVYVPKPLMVQRCFPGGLGRNPLNYLENTIKVLEKNIPAFPRLAPLFKEGLGITCRAAAWYELREGRYGLARRHWWRQFRYRRPSARDLLTAVLLAGGGMGGRLAARQWRDILSGLR